MARKSAISPARMGQILTVYRKILKYAFVGVGLFHVLFLMGTYAMSGDYFAWDLAGELDVWLPFALICALAVYALAAAFAAPAEQKRLKEAIKKRLTADQLLLSALFVWCLLGCAVLQSGQGGDFFSYQTADGQTMGLNYSVVYSINDRFLRDMVISFFVLFPLGSLFNEKERRRLLNIIIHLLTIIATAVASIVLINMFNHHLTYLPGGQAGMNTRGSLVIACNANTTGAFSALLLLLCAYMITVKRSAVLRILYLIAAVIQFILLCMSNSRAALYSIVISAAFVGFRAVWGSRIKFSSNTVRIVISVAIGLTSACALLMLGRITKEQCFNLATNVRTSAPTPTPSGRESNVGETLSFSIEETLNGRLELWGNCLQVAFANTQNALIGVTPGLVEYAIGIVRHDLNNVFYAHNQVFQMLVAFGLPGLVLFIAWLVVTAKRCMRVGLKSRHFILPVVLLMMVAAGAAESYLVAYLYFCGSMFFLISGMVKSEDDALTRAEKASGRPGKSKK